MTPVRAKIDAVGSMFRFITPILIIFLGYMMNVGYTDIREKLKEISNHEKRISHLEWTVFKTEYKTTSINDN